MQFYCVQETFQKTFPVDNMKKTGLNGYVYDFSVDYDTIAVDDILDIHKYLMKKNDIKKMFRFIKKIFITVIGFIRLSVVNPLKRVSMSNRECKVRAAVMKIDSNEPSFSPYSILVNKFSGSCNDINNPYAKLCIPNVVKNMDIKVFNLMSRTNETCYIEWHKVCECKCKLDASVCNDRQR